MSELGQPSSDPKSSNDLRERDGALNGTSDSMPGESRLLLVLSGELPAEVLLALQHSPLSVEEVGVNLLGSGPISNTDSILVGDVRRLDQVVTALEKRKALSTPIIAVGHPSRLQLDEERLRGLKLTVFPRTWDANQVVRRTVQLVLQHLKNGGAVAERNSERSPVFVEAEGSPVFVEAGVVESVSAPQLTKTARATRVKPVEQPVRRPRPAAPRPHPNSHYATMQKKSVDRALAGKLSGPKPHPPSHVIPSGVAPTAETPLDPCLTPVGRKKPEAECVAVPQNAVPEKPESSGGHDFFDGRSSETSPTNVHFPRPAALPKIDAAAPRSSRSPSSEPNPADTPPTKLSLRAPPEVQEAGRRPPVSVRSWRPPFDTQESLPYAPPSSRRRLTSRPPPHLTEESMARKSRRFSMPPVSMAPDGRTLRATRWVIVDDQEIRSQAIATCLRQLGAKVETVGLSDPSARLPAARQLDAIGYIIDEQDIRRAGRVLHAFAADPRLRWMRLVSLRWREIFDEKSAGVVVETLTRCLELHWETEWEALEQLLRGLEIGVERLGMPRLLVAASKARGARSMRIASLQHDYVLSLKNGSVLTAARDGKAVLAAELPTLFAEILCISDGSAILESDSQLEGPPLAQLSQLLRQHAASLSEPPIQQCAERVEPAFDGANRLNPRQSRLGPLGFPAWDKRRAADAIRYYRIPLAAGAVTLVSSFALAPLIRSYSDPENRVAAADVTPNPAAVVSQQGADAPEKIVDQSVKAEVKEENQRSVLDVDPPVEKELPTEASQAPLGSRLRVPNRSCERLLAETPLPEGLRIGQAKSAWHLARKALVQGDLKLAEERLCLSAHLNPEGPGVVDLIRFYFMQNDFAAAKAGAEWALGQRAADPAIKQLLADALNVLGEPQEGRKLLLDSMNIAASDKALILRVARRFSSAGHKVLKGGDPAQAERLFRRAVSLDDANLLATTGLAEMAFKNNALSDAEHWARRAVELEPRSFQAQFTLGEVLDAQDRVSESKAAYRVALQLNPGSSVVRQRLGLE